MSRSIRCALTGLILALALPLHAATYKWVDAEGRVVYSQSPPADVEYQVINTGGARYSTADSTEAEESGATIPDAGPASGDPEQEIEEIAAQSEAIRQQNCQAAKQNLQTYQTYRRVRDDAGNVTTLTDTERQAKIEEAKQMIADFCD